MRKYTEPLQGWATGKAKRAQLAGFVIPGALGTPTTTPSLPSLFFVTTFLSCQYPLLYQVCQPEESSMQGVSLVQYMLEPLWDQLKVGALTSWGEEMNSWFEVWCLVI